MLRRVRARRTAWLAERLARSSPTSSRRSTRRSSRCRGCCDGARCSRCNARTFASLRQHRNYRLFFTGQVISVTARGCRTWRSRGSSIELTDSPLAVGALAFCRFIPFTIFGLFAGVARRPLDNRRLVIGTQAAQMVVSIALAVLALTGAATSRSSTRSPRSAASALVFDAPGRHALTFQLVGRERAAERGRAELEPLQRLARHRPRDRGRRDRRRRCRRLLRRQRVQLPRRARGAAVDADGRAVPVERDAEPPTCSGGIREGFAYALGTTARPRRARRSSPW